MKSKTVFKAMLGFYIFLFFAYLFGPILVMSYRQLSLARLFSRQNSPLS